MAESAVETPPEPKKKPASGPPRRNKGGRPSKTAAPPPTHSIFESMSRIQKADWGTRATVYVYRTEPMIDRTRTGDLKYIQVYAEPVSEEQLMHDHGSGRYKLMLNFKKPGAEIGDELDTGYVEILNTQFPPKIPEGHWVDDPKNNKWSWAKASFKKDTPSSSGDPVEMLRVLHEVQQDAIHNQRGEGEQGKTILEAVKVGLAMAAPQSATENTTLKTIMDMTMMMVSKSQEESRELRAELRALRDRPVPAQINPLDMITATIDKLTPVVEKIWPKIKQEGAEVAATVTRSRMSSWQEFFAPVLPGVVDLLKPVAGAVAQGLLTNPAQTNGAGPRLTNPAPATSNPPNIESVGDLLNFLTPVLVDYVRDEERTGGDFADWLCAGWGEERLDKIREASVDQMVFFLRKTRWWSDKGKQGNFASLAELEPRLRAFLGEFMTWRVPEEEGEDNENEVIDLTAETAVAAGDM